MPTEPIVDTICLQCDQDEHWWCDDEDCQCDSDLCLQRRDLQESVWQ